MRYYINPTDETKESFLFSVGRCYFISFVIKQNINDFCVSDCRDNCLPVVLIDNVTFTAAGIAYSPEELDRYLNAPDTREKQLFTVPIDKLLEVSCLPKHIKNKNDAKRA